MANLDVHRAFAVLLVMGSHTVDTFAYLNSALHYGLTGLYLFFVHTCCVLMSSLERQQRTQADGLAWRFYIRRIFRIYPLAWLVLFGCLLVAAAIGKSIARSPADVFANAALMQNLFKAPIIIRTSWTLPLELHMYGVLPFLYLALPRLGLREVTGSISGTCQSCDSWIPRATAHPAWIPCERPRPTGSGGLRTERHLLRGQL